MDDKIIEIFAWLLLVMMVVTIVLSEIPGARGLCAVCTAITVSAMMIDNDHYV